MSETTKIQWTDATVNWWEGCTKISAGCAACYAEARDKRFHAGAHWGRGAPRLSHIATATKTCLAMNKKPWVCDTCGYADAERSGLLIHRRKSGCYGEHRRRVFSLSLGDIFDEEVPIEWLADALDVIRRCPNLDWLLLTKRPENWAKRLLGVSDFLENERAQRPPDWPMLFQWVEEWAGHVLPQNIWLGVSVENQPTADQRIPLLLQIPAKVRFVSYEPALEAVEFSNVSGRSDAVKQLGKKALTGIDWIIVGGESGKDARPFRVDWMRSVIEQCRYAGVACFCKQLGANVVGNEMEKWVCRLRDSHGGDMEEWAPDLRVRQFPEVNRSCG